MITKKYNYPNMLFCNEFTYRKLEQFADELAIFRLHWQLKTIKDFKVVVREECKNNEIYFYINRKNNGEIVSYKFEDLLR